MLTQEPWQSITAITLWHLGIYLGLQARSPRIMLIAFTVIFGALAWLSLAWFRAFGGLATELNLITLICAVIAALTASGMLLIKKPLFAALSFALSILAMSTLFLLNNAAFLMAATVIIYAGAIVVTFLFVIMLAQQRGEASYDTTPREPFLACFAGWMLSIGPILVLKNLTDTWQRPLSLSQRTSQTASPNPQALDQAIRHTRTALSKLTNAINKKQPRDQIVATLFDESNQDTALATAMQSLRTLSSLSEKNFSAIHQRIEKHYELLLQTLAQEPLDYASALEQASELDRCLEHYVKLSEGGRALTTIKSPADTRGLGTALFSYYLLPVVFAGFLLLLATIGSLIVGKPKRGKLET
ncbi:MAG: NADH-quinone oxidoreductase subunit J [Gemmatales bacterium]|nr:NADH-quinone oxidoreductase subunit J [Gemmatales bacterium]MDW7993387.1 NADH-quinone oxidoreductase subunit J [Gemmatales bacterium]